MLWGTKVFSETLRTPKLINPKSIFQNYSQALTSSKLVIFSLVVGCCSIISYCFSAAAPQIAHDLLFLSAAEYGYWNSLNIVGMLCGGFLVKELLARFSVSWVLILGFIGMAMGIASLFELWINHSNSAAWFFLTTASLYLFSSFLFSGGSFIASNAITDKASAVAMMSFVNMCFATVAVILMGYLGTNPLFGFILILSLSWLLVVGLVALEWGFNSKMKKLESTKV